MGLGEFRFLLLVIIEVAVGLLNALCSRPVLGDGHTSNPDSNPWSMADNS